MSFTDSCYVTPVVPSQFEQTIIEDKRHVNIYDDVVPRIIISTSPVPLPRELMIAPRRILIIGDSEACAVAPYVKDVKLLSDTVDVDCKNGTVVQYWAVGGYFKSSLVQHRRPDTVLIFLGTNHYWQDKVPNVMPILDLIKQRDLNCIWIGNTAVHGQNWPMNHLIQNAVTPTCQYFNTEVADIPLPDRIHPGPSGALKWLNLIWPMIPMKYEQMRLGITTNIEKLLNMVFIIDLTETSQTSVLDLK